MTEIKFPTEQELSADELIIEANHTLSSTLASASLQINEVFYDDHFPDTILAGARACAKPLVSRIEEVEPGGMHGLNKVWEMEKLAERVEWVGVGLNLEKTSRQILKIILGTHDLGRHVEKILALDTLRGGVRHGVFSLLFLSRNNLLDGLSERDKYVVLFSVCYHSEKDVPVPAANAHDFENLAYELCYVLRDLDKEHALEETKYMEPSGILIQLKAHYLPKDLITILNGNKDTSYPLETLIDSYLTGNHLDSISGVPENLLPAIKNVMTTNVHPSILEAFDTNQTASVQFIRHSWSSYLAIRLAMLFDIRNQQILDRVVTNSRKNILDSISYINRFDSIAAEKIRENLNDYLKQRLGTTFELV